MPAAQRAFDRGTQRGVASLHEIGSEFRNKRLAIGISQRHVADGVAISRSTYSRIENARLRHLPIVLSAQIGAVLGLDLVVRLYPGPNPVRDTAHRERLMRILNEAAPPLRYRTEVPLPQRASGIPEQRAWDAELTGHGRRTALEMEMRIRDGQALERRFQLKLRDDPVDNFLLVVADTTANRRTLRDDPALLAGHPRLRRSTVLDALRQGRHPPSGVVLF